MLASVGITPILEAHPFCLSRQSRAQPSTLLSERTMKTQPSGQTRRDFLSDVGRGMITAAIGYGMASELRLASAPGGEAPPARLEFGASEPLARLMQETPAAKLMPILVGKLRSGADLRQLVT